MRSAEKLMEEDRIICERIQKGMKARHGRGGQLLELDRAIKDFHHFLGWRIFDHELAEAWREKVASGETGPHRSAGIPSAR